jgi:hypothetical protein
LMESPKPAECPAKQSQCHVGRSCMLLMSSVEIKPQPVEERAYCSQASSVR